MHLLGRGLPNKYRLPNADIQTVFSLFLCISLKFNSVSITFSSRFDELRGDFCFFKKTFQKHPPRIVSHFKQVKGLLFFLSKIPPFFCFPVQTSEGINFLKEIFEKSVNLGVHFGTLCPNEWKEFFYGKIIKEIKTGMVLFYQSQNRQKNIQRLVPQMSEWL